MLGWMADRYGRGLTLKLAASVATVTMFLMPFAMGHSLFLVPLLFAAGGAIAGIYALGVILIGQDFRGQQLAAVSTGFGMAYSAGSIVGATPVGYLIDLFGPEALPISIAVGFLGLTVFLLLRAPEANAAAANDVVLPGIDNLPDIKFDLSFPWPDPPSSLLDEREAVDVEQAEVGDLQVRDDRQRQEGRPGGRVPAACSRDRRAPRGGALQRAARTAVERLQADQPGDGQRYLGQHLAA